MTSKYDKILSQLLPLPAEDTNYQKKVDEAKPTVGALVAMFYAIAEEAKADTDIVVKNELPSETHTPESLAKTYSASRAAKEILEGVLFELQIRVTALEQMLVASHDEDETGWGEYGAPESTVRLASGAGVRVEKEPMGKVTDRERFRRWCLANGYENEMRLHDRTAQTVVKERLLAGQPVPDGIEAFFRPKVKLLKP